MKIPQMLHNFGSYFESMRVLDILDILLVAALIFFLAGLIRRTNSSKVFMGIVIILAALWISGLLKLYTVNFILKNTVQIGLIALVVLFQPEIRRFLERMGAGASLRQLLQGKQAVTQESGIQQIVAAFSEMSSSKTGALIVFERDNSLDEQVRTGTVINADISAELIKNIFFNKAPLHDGAVIIRSGRVLAAGCMLPLSGNTNLSRDLGMRHRAALGMSENSDAVIAIVSEETGSISVAIDGMLKRHLSRNAFEKVLRNELLPPEERPDKVIASRKSGKKGGEKNE